MVFFKNTYTGLLILLCIFAGVGQLKAQSTISSPKLCCVAIDSAGDATLTWITPSNLNPSFISYRIFELGHSAPVATVITSTQTSVTIPAASLPFSPKSASVHFYMYDSTSHGNSVPIDTLSSMHLILSNLGTGVNLLQWNATHNPTLSSSSKWYRIYREYKYRWTLIDSTQNFQYKDTITYCKAFLTYKVENVDSTICVSVSNYDTGTIESEVAPPQIYIDTVSVNSANTIDITWYRSSKNNVIGYVIYEELPSGSYEPIDTVYGVNTTLFNFTNCHPSDSVYTFEVAALDSCGIKSSLSSSQNNILLKETPNSCERTNLLNWNQYTDLLGGIGGYTIYYNINGGIYQVLATTASDITTYLDTNLITTEERCYIIAVFDSANSAITASSNKVCYSIHAPTKPRNDYLKVATVIFNTSQINIEAYIDSISGAGFYVFQRSTDSTGGFKSVDTMPAPLHTEFINYIDNSANPSLQSYFYKIITEDSCFKPMDTTNLGETIFLNAIGQPHKINQLFWNDYRDWYKGPAYYLIYRSLDGVNYEFRDTVKYSDAGEYEYLDNVDSVIVGPGIFYYYVEAVENNKAGVYPFTDTSYSNVALAYQNPVLFIPSAFNPNGINRIFIPVGIFVGIKGYDFSIFNRWGNLIFETNNPEVGWDGKDGGSKTVQEDLYFYLITYTSNKGEYFQQKGSVTLLK